MEATGFNSDHRKEVEERPARTWFATPVDHTLRYVQLLDYTSTWDQIDVAVAYARLQDRDKYALSAKFIRDTWYCSKLVWAAVYEGIGRDIDPDGGFYVYPYDIERSAVTFPVYLWED